MPKTDADRMFTHAASTQHKVPTYPVFARGASVIVVNSSGMAKITPAYRAPANFGDIFSAMGFGAGR